MSDTGIQKAVAALILTTGVVPSTTLTAQASAGATSVTVTDGSSFTSNGDFWFADALGEEGIPISAVSGNTVTFNFTGMGYNGLQYTHPNGTTVYTNLATERAADVAPMLVKGKPFVSVEVSGQEEEFFANRYTITQYHVRVQYHRLLATDGSAPNVWFRRQMAAARADLETIATALRTDWHLIVAGQAQTAVAMGTYGQRKPNFRRQWNRVTKSWDTDQIVCALEFDLYADPKPLS